VGRVRGTRLGVLSRGFVIFDVGFLILPAVAGHGRANSRKGREGEIILLVRTMVGSLLVGRTEFLHCLEIKRIQEDVAYVLNIAQQIFAKKQFLKKWVDIQSFSAILLSNDGPRH
jgi:hypothetical protein